MADRILTWYLENLERDGVEQGPAYYIERDYVPVALRVLVRGKPDAGNLTFDIKDDGVTILASTGFVGKGDTREPDAETFPRRPATIQKDSIVTFDITSSGGAKGISVHLELDAV